MGAAVPANAAPAFTQDDPACQMLGRRHLLYSGGAFDSPPDDGIPGDNAAMGGHTGRLYAAEHRRLLQLSTGGVIHRIRAMNSAPAWLSSIRW
jgi:hypothetical protein